MGRTPKIPKREDMVRQRQILQDGLIVFGDTQLPDVDTTSGRTLMLNNDGVVVGGVGGGTGSGIDPSGYADGQVPRYNQQNNDFEAGNALEDIVAGNSTISIDKTDAANPIITANLQSGGVYHETTTASKSVFDVGFNLPSSPANILVFAPGLLAPTADYTITGAQEVTLGTAVTSGTDVLIAVPGALFINQTGDTVSDGFIPVRDQTGFVNSPLRFDSTENRLISSVSLEVPGSTVYVSENLGIEASGIEFGVFDIANNRRGFLVTYERTDASGSTRPFYRKLGTQVANQVLQPLQDVNSPVGFTETITGTQDRLINAIYFIPAANATNVSFSLAYAAAPDVEIFSGSLPSVTANVKVRLPISQGLFTEENEDYIITATGLSVKGTTINNSFASYLEIDSNPMSVVSIVTDDEYTSAIPVISNFAININSRVDLNTDLNQSHIVSYRSVHAHEISTLTLDVTTGDNKTLTIPVDDNGIHTETVTLSGITTSTAGTVAFKITGTDTQNRTFESNTYNVSVRNVANFEALYWGISNTNNPASIDTTGMSSADATISQHTVTATTTQDSQYFIILAPTDHDVTSITDTVFNQDVTNIFTKTTNVRTIGSQSYNSYVLGPLSNGLNEQYVVELA